MSLDYTLAHSALGLFPFSHEIQRRQLVAMMDEMISAKPEASVKTWWTGYIMHENTCKLRRRLEIS